MKLISGDLWFFSGPANLSLNSSSATTTTTVWIIGVPQSLSVSSSYFSGYPTASFSVSPALPTGLSLNVSSGEIFGTAVGVVAATNYTLTATDSAGNVSVVMSLAVAGTHHDTFSHVVAARLVSCCLITKHLCLQNLFFFSCCSACFGVLWCALCVVCLGVCRSISSFQSVMLHQFHQLYSVTRAAFWVVARRAVWQHLWRCDWVQCAYELHGDRL